jgi:site-specific DNA-methyltransferase (adenine-specific)
MSTTFLQGDCLEVMKTLPDKSVDCFVCDLPYGCLISQSAKKVSGCAWDIKINLEKFWTEVKRLAKSDNTPVIHFCNTKFGNDLINSNPTWFRYDLVWDKQRGVSFLLANKQPMKSHEMIYVFAKKAPYYKRVDIQGTFSKQKGGKFENKSRTTIPASDFCIGKPNDGTHRCPLSIVSIPKNRTGDCHPTEKPKELYKWLLERYCPAEGTVLDPTAGSFNSVVVAKELGLKGIGIEKDEGFYKAAVERNKTPDPPETPLAE